MLQEEVDRSREVAESGYREECECLYDTLTPTMQSIVLSFFAVVVACAVLFLFLSIPKEWNERLWAKSSNEATVNAWLEEQRKGRGGSEYWATSSKVNGKPPVMFYAVRSWEIVDAICDINFTVRIESSTKGGQPIIKLWEVWSYDGKISGVDEKID